MSTTQLFEKMKTIAVVNDENRYTVLSLTEMPHKLGCSEEGYPKFFVLASEVNSMMRNLTAELLSVEYDTICNIVEGGVQTDNLRFTIITLRSENELLQNTFIDIFQMMLKMLPPKPTNLMIASKVESLLTIFSKLKKRPIHKMQGLWAELLVIEQSKDPSTVANAWHTTPESKYDFTMGRDKIEVKSTSGENRTHRFALDQLNPSINSRLLVCSIITRESAKDENGLSVFDLYDCIGNKISSDDIRLHVYNVMLDTLGCDFYTAKKKYFDYSTARDSLALFDHTDIPKIDKTDIPEHVTEVRFSADLSHLTDVREKGYDRDDSTLFHALY